jgi:hypothetical protein
MRAPSSLFDLPKHMATNSVTTDGLNAVSGRAASPSGAQGPEQPAPKTVNFIPLSPKSSRTLQLHHQEIEGHKDAESVSEYMDGPTPDEESSNQLVPSQRSLHPRSRRLSDPSANRPVPQRHYSSKGSDSDEEDVIEVLPDRFDAQGRPVDRPVLPRLHSLRGDFVYRSPRADGWNVQGQWGVTGTDGEAVERIVQRVTSVVEGRGSLLGLLGGILSGSLLEPGSEHSGDESRRSSRRSRMRDRDWIEDGYDEGYRRRSR